MTTTQAAPAAIISLVVGFSSTVSIENDSGVIRPSSMLVATTLPRAVIDIGGHQLIGWAFSLYQLGSIVAGAASALLVARFGLRGAMIAAAIYNGTVTNAVVIMGLAGTGVLLVFLARPIICPEGLVHHATD